MDAASEVVIATFECGGIDLEKPRQPERREQV
jgi:hypothetical protein